MRKEERKQQDRSKQNKKRAAIKKIRKKRENTRHTVFILDIDIGRIVQDELDQIQASLARGPMQQTLACGLCDDVRISAMCKQILHQNTTHFVIPNRLQCENEIRKSQKYKREKTEQKEKNA
jgi:hypothetical protein